MQLMLSSIFKRKEITYVVCLTALNRLYALEFPFLLGHEPRCLDTFARLPWPHVLESLGFVSLALS